MTKQIASLSKAILSKVRLSSQKKQAPTFLKGAIQSGISQLNPKSDAVKPALTKPTDNKISKQNDPIGSCTVTCGALNVRSGAGTDYPRIGGLSKGQTVKVYEASGGWLKITYGSGHGWIMQKYTDYKTPESEPDTQETGVITAESLNVRTGPGTSYESIGYLHNGDKVTILGESNGWYKINYNGQEAWVSGKYVDKTEGGSTPEPEQPPASTDGTVVVVDATTLNVRTGPSADYSKLGSLGHGDKVSVLEEKDGWYRIDYNGQDGWIKASYTHAPGEADPAGQKAADHAYSLMNTCVNEGWTYSQSKRSQNGHYDCSSFTARCWKAAGYDFKWANSVNQAKTIYDAVGELDVSEVQPGDLLFYHSNWDSGERWRGINHVAIAVGGGRRIDAGGTPVENISGLGSPVMVGRPSKLMS